ncbi:MAG: selenoneine synthase SenA [Casimicrobiaceae bacterium]
MTPQRSRSRAPRTPDELHRALREAREYTLSIYAHLDAPARRFPLLAVVNPPLWELGHLAWFQEYWCVRGGPRSAPRVPALHTDADVLWNSSVVPHDTRWDLPLPDGDALATYMDATLEATLTRLAVAEDRYFFELALYHEDMHAEALLMTLQTLGLPAPARQATVEHGRADEMAGRGQRKDDVAIPAHDYARGARREDTTRRFVFDNEKWAHPVHVDAFRMAACSVTNAEFQAFVDDDGYRRTQFWSDAGRAWLATAARTAPAYWSRDPRGPRGPRGNWQVRRFARQMPLAPTEPVQHVNAHEAEAWCRWAGRRLPTEIEWEAGARWFTAAGEDQDEPYGAGERSQAEPSDDAAFESARLDGEALGPRPVRLAAHPTDLIGNVWEWTASPFEPYPGFAPDPYEDYSAPWFGTHRVLRGGSWATRARLVHPGFRNFYTPDRHDPFVGFRTCTIG